MLGNEPGNTLDPIELDPIEIGHSGGGCGGDSAASVATAGGGSDVFFSYRESLKEKSEKERCDFDALEPEEQLRAYSAWAKRKQRLEAVVVPHLPTHTVCVQKIKLSYWSMEERDTAREAKVLLLNSSTRTVLTSVRFVRRTCQTRRKKKANSLSWQSQRQTPLQSNRRPKRSGRNFLRLW
jgi:hypothetical protein